MSLRPLFVSVVAALVPGAVVTGPPATRHFSYPQPRGAKLARYKILDRRQRILVAGDRLTSRGRLNFKFAVARFRGR